MAAFRDAVHAFRDALRAVDVDAFTWQQCAELVGDVARLRKACEAAEVALGSAGGVVRCASSRLGTPQPPTGWRPFREPLRMPPRIALETAAEVEARPDTRDALFDGRVSMAQAHEIAATEQVAPGHEAALIEMASSASLRRVRDVARDIRASVIPPDDLEARRREARSLVSWRDELGMVCLKARLMPQDGIALLERIERQAKQLRRSTRSVEPFEALAADAFVELVKGSGSTSARWSTELVLVCDVAAWMRGHGHDGEVAKIVGGGPLPVSVMRALAENAFLKVVLHDGVQVQTVAHYGRSIPAHVRTALELGFPPDFNGPRCSEPGCDRTHLLERDHDDPVANGGPTNASNLGWKCEPDHREKTKRDRAAGKLGSRAP